MDFSEFAAGMIDWQTLQAVEKDWNVWVEKVFTGLDKDGNGYIDMSEIMSYAPAAVHSTTSIH